MRNRLKTIREARGQLLRLKGRMQALEEIAPAVSRYSAEPRGGARMDLSALLAKREELEEEYSALAAWYIGECDRMLAAFECLSPLERNVLELYYLQGKGWDAVAAELYISGSWCFKVRRRALDKIVKYSLKA